MQDRFRFRYWDKQINKMRTGDILMGSDGNAYIIGMDTGTPIVQEIDDVEPMQCTGLKDKNGKLIYEGDIVKVANGSVNSKVCKNIYAVEWTPVRWNIPNWTENKPNFSHYVKVIGNKYENPELLKGGEE